MIEYNPNNNKGENKPVDKSLLEAEYFYAKWKRENSEDKFDQLNREEDSLSEEYHSKLRNLYSKFPTEYENMNSLQKEKDALWSIYYDERIRMAEENPKADPLDIAETPELELLYEEYKKKREEYENAETILENLIPNFPKEEKDIELTQEKYSITSQSRREFSNEYLLDKNNFSNIYKEYASLESDWYEKIVNTFSLEVNKYRKIKEAKLKKRLNDGLAEIMIFNPENKDIHKNLIAKQLFIINELSSQFKKWMTRTTLLTFSILALSWGIQKAKDEIKNEKVKSKIDNFYKSIIQTNPLDSVTEIILHDIAGDKELPHKWREFLVKEDSSEFFVSSLKEEYDEYKNKKDENMGDIDFENKISYIAILRMNEKYGKPKAKYGTTPNFHDRACYYISLNTMHLPTYAGHFSIADYLAELSHSVQFKGPDSTKYYAWHNKDYLKTDSIAKKEGVSYDDAQIRQYSDTATLEYNAHSIIEPKLIEEFKKTKEDIINEVYNSK